MAARGIDRKALLHMATDRSTRQSGRSPTPVAAQEHAEETE
jgi:hypothetical protein